MVMIEFKLKLVSMSPFQDPEHQFPTNGTTMVMLLNTITKQEL